MSTLLDDLAGKQFGRWKVIKRVANRNKKTAWLCECKCGITRIVLSVNLKKNSRSCGCLQKDQLRDRSITHKQSKSVEYRIWASMLHRCRNSKNQKYALYGGRGIKVCERWHKFENFLADMGKRPSNEFSLERKDNNGYYCPENCKWAILIEQNNNKRTNKRLIFDGFDLTIAQWARKINIKRATLVSRLNRLNWSIEKTLTEPVTKNWESEKII